jgi:hypothetical protein
MIRSVEQLAQDVGVRKACRALGVPKNRIYRCRQAQKAEPPERRARVASPRTLHPVFRINRRARCMPACWTKASICVPGG